MQRTLRPGCRCRRHPFYSLSLTRGARDGGRRHQVVGGQLQVSIVLHQAHKASLQRRAKEGCGGRHQGQRRGVGGHHAQAVGLVLRVNGGDSAVHSTGSMDAGGPPRAAHLRPALAVELVKFRILQRLGQLNHTVSTEVEDHHSVTYGRAMKNWCWAGSSGSKAGKQRQQQRAKRNKLRWRQWQP